MNVKRLFRGFVTTLMMTVLCVGTAFAEFSAETETVHNEIGIGQWPKDAELQQGGSLNHIFRNLTGTSINFSTPETQIKAIKHSDTPPVAGVKTEEMQVEGSVPVLAWFESGTGTIYWYSEAETVYTNPNMGQAFENLQSLNDLSGVSDWNTSRMTSLDSTFVGCSQLTNIDGLGTWDTSKLEYLSQTFSGCINLTDLSGLAKWKTSNVMWMDSAFSGCSSLTNLDELSEWDMSSATYIEGMFKNCSALADASCLSTHQADGYTAWDMSKVMFSYNNNPYNSRVFSNTKLESDYVADPDQYTKYPDWFLKKTRFMNETSKVADVQYPVGPGMCESAKPDDPSQDGFVFKGWNTSVSGDGDALSFTSGLCSNPAETYYAVWEEKQDTVLQPGGVLNSEFKLLTSANSIQAIKHSAVAPGINVTTREIQESGEKVLAWFNNNEKAIYWYSNADTVYANKQMNSAFYGFGRLTNLSGLSDWNTSLVTSLHQTFWQCYSLTDLEGLESWDTSQLVDLGETFYGCSSLENVDALKRWNTEKVQSLDATFYGCKVLRNVDGLSEWKTEVTGLSGLANTFHSCESLVNVDGLINLDTSQIKGSLIGTFNGCSSLENLNGLKNWNVEGVTSLESTFYGCKALKNVDGLSEWKTGAVTAMEKTFSGCAALTSIDGIAKWNTEKVTSLSSVFSSCSSLTNVDALANWHIGKVKSLGNAFAYCRALVDVDGLSEWDTGALTGLSGTFEECTSLVDIDGLSKWDTSQVTMLVNAFRNCSNLTDASCLSTHDEGDYVAWNVSRSCYTTGTFDGTGITDSSKYPTWYYKYSAVSPSALTLDGNGGTVFGKPVITITPEAESEPDTEPESLSAEYGIDPVMLDDEMVLPDIVLLDDAAYWEPEEDVTVASPSVATPSVASASDVLRNNILVLPEAERNGYTFLGWSDEEDGEVVYEAGDEIVIDGEMVLYAVWSEETAVVTPSNASRSDEPGDAGAASDPDVTEATPSEASRAKEDEEEIPSSRPDPEPDPEPAPIEAATPSEPKRETDASESDPVDGEPIEPNHTNE